MSEYQVCREYIYSLLRHGKKNPCAYECDDHSNCEKDHLDETDVDYIVDLIEKDRNSED